jgi:hypothetical protein
MEIADMRNFILLPFMAVSLIWSSSGYCQDSEGGPLGDPLPPPVQDPSLSSSHYFSPSLTTAGVADTGRALGSMNVRYRTRHSCNVVTPCALPSPALDRAIAAHAG